MRAASLVIAASVAAITVSVWAYFNQPDHEAPWPDHIQGFSFSPFHAGEDAIAHRFPTDEEINSDLKLLSGKTDSIRTYTMEGSIADIPRLAAPYGMKVMLGAWVDSDKKKSDAQIAELIEAAHRNPNVKQVLVGNEVVLTGILPTADLIHYLDKVRGSVRQPVGTAETWSTWMLHPELVDHVDFMGVHMLPYWEGVDVNQAVDYIDDRMRDLEKRYPDKPIVIDEVGWPSYGRTRHAAVASPANEAMFLRRFIDLARRREWTYRIMEAFDQPWKEQTEGAVGAYWGVWDVNRQPKFAMRSPIVRIPEWPMLAGVSVLLAATLLMLILGRSHTLRHRGRGFIAVVVYTATTTLVWVFYDYTQQYLTVTNIAVGLLLFVGMIGVVLVLLTETHEWAEAHWVVMRRRAFEPLRAADEDLPMVSVQVPAYDEPPDMLRETLDALSRLDYPRFEVLVIDNNTRDEAKWRPVEEHCRKLGPGFRFFHVAPLAGFKAGALNFALSHTAPSTSIVAVIDSDYVVDPHWLRDMAPLFANPQMGVVQAPQDYRDADASAFKAMCYAEYRGFFYIGMITRNERNAIIQHGTMTMIRRSLLQQVGAWSEWCITEDAELGLKVFEAGFEAAYIPKSYGRGLMPDTLLDYKKQRFRWAYGAVQILKHHARRLFSRGPLTLGQRYHFLAGWLPWLSDGFNLVFNTAAMFWSVGMALFPHSIDPPLMIFSALPLALFAFKILKLLHLYSTRVGASVRQTLAAALAGLALSHTIGLAVMQGIFTRDQPFFRTPKRAENHALLQALYDSREEGLMMFGLWLAALAVYLDVSDDMRDVSVWIAVLLIQSIPYAATLLMSLVSAYPQLPSKYIGHADEMDTLAHVVLDERI
ncbi:MAG TPA: glycosyltransferase [Gammaproteobacteria bacterium]|jgi:exo-beta-1,3-glucanase (GH17 family)/cellulose synthase/poly-beta-1,6-N-acetylglucosamine synthase-like glycosyltransferase